MNFYIRRLLSGIQYIVGGTVAFLLIWMVLLALFQLVLRWMFSTGIPWADIQLRQMVLWVGLLGGVLAASNKRHIRIDLIEHINTKIKFVIEKIVFFIACIISFGLCYISIRFVKLEYEAHITLDRVLFGYSASLWSIELVIPISFGLMGIYFLATAILPDQDIN